MSVGIIGAGGIGRALAIQAQRAGRTATLANSRGPESLADLVAELGDGVVAGTVAQAAQCELVAIPVPWSQVPTAVAGIEWDDRIVIDPTNPLEPPGFVIQDLGGRSSGRVVSEMLPGARLVKVANTLPADVLASNPAEAGGQRVLVLSGDDGDAKRAVSEFFGAAGFATIDLGGLDDGGRLQDVSPGIFRRVNLIRLP